ncbi:hypothetical protein MRX96_022477 [Rhipicephalus microplus]
MTQSTDVPLCFFLNDPSSAGEDTFFDDYYIPKGTTISPNVWAVHNDPTLWKEPSRFNPDRFLREDGSLIQPRPEYLIPFSDSAERRNARPLVRPTPEEAMPHEAMVEGEQISKEEAESNGWITAHRKRNADKTRFKHETHSARQTGAHVGPAKASQLRKVAAASRLPRLPTSHFRVVVRPGGRAGRANMQSG